MKSEPLSQPEALERMANNLGLESVPAHWQGRSFKDVYSELTDVMCLTLDKLGTLYVDKDGSAKEYTRQAIQQKIDLPPHFKRVDSLCRILTTPTHKSLYAFIDSNKPQSWENPLQDSLETAKSPLDQAKQQGLLGEDLKPNIPLYFNDEERLKLAVINKAVIQRHYPNTGYPSPAYTMYGDHFHKDKLGYSNKIKFLHRLGIRNMDAFDEAIFDCAEQVEHSQLLEGRNYTLKELGACAQAVREYRGMPLKMYEKVGMTVPRGNDFEKKNKGYDSPFYEKRTPIAKLLGCGDETKDANDSHIDAMMVLGRKLQALDENAMRAAIAALIDAKVASSAASRDDTVRDIAKQATSLYPEPYSEYRRDDDGYSPALISPKDIVDFLDGIERFAHKIFTYSRIERTAQALGVKHIFALEELGILVQAGVVGKFSFNADGRAIPQFKEDVSQKELDDAFRRMGVEITREDDYFTYQKKVHAERTERRKENGPFFRGAS